MKELTFEQAKKLVIILNKENPKIALFTALSICSPLKASKILNLSKEQITENEIQLPNSFYDMIDVKTIQEQPFLNKRGTGIVTIQHITQELKLAVLNNFNIQNDINTNTLRKLYGNRFYSLSKDKYRAICDLRIQFKQSSISVTKKYLGIEEEEEINMMDEF